MDEDLYDQHWQVEQRHWWFQARQHIVCSTIERYVENSDGRRLRIADLGCGTGGILTALAEQHDVAGIEFSPKALAYARTRLGDRVQQGGLPHDVNLPPASFDVVLLTDVVEHIEDDAEVARTAMGLLRPGGIVLATVPAYQWLFSRHDVRHHHFRRYGRQQFRQLWTNAGGEILLLSYFNMLLFPPAAAIRLLEKTFPSRSSYEGLSVPVKPINWALTQVMRSEAPMLGRVPLPFGLSLIAVVRRPKE